MEEISDLKLRQLEYLTKKNDAEPFPNGTKGKRKATEASRPESSHFCHISSCVPRLKTLKHAVLCTAESRTPTEKVAKDGSARAKT